MKKLTFFIFSLLLSLCLILPCFAGQLNLTIHGTGFKITVDNYKEYKQILKETEAHDRFVSYERISFLGEFAGFKALDITTPGNTYYYDLIASDGAALNLAFAGNPDGDIVKWEAGTGDLASENDLRRLNVEAFLERDTLYEKDYFDELSGFYIVYEFNVYHYDLDGALTCIEFNFLDGSNVIIRADFSTCTPDSWVGKLLNTQTAREASTDIRLRQLNVSAEPWKVPLAICLSSIGGAAVAAVATYLIMRKKVKNPPRLADNGEIPASAGEAIAPIDENSASENTQNTP